MQIEINTGIGEIYISTGNLKLNQVMEELKDFVFDHGIDKLHELLTQDKKPIKR